MNNKNPFRIWAVVCSLFAVAHCAFAQGTAFTYQGQLVNGGSPANGNFDFTFALFNNSTNSGQVGSALTNLDVGVTNGLFTVTLDFGPVFTGDATWLAIGVRANGGASFTALNPLQELTPTPYAIYAASANAVAPGGTVPLTALPAAVVTNGESGINISGTFSGNGAGVTNVPGTIPWQTVSGVSVTASPNQAYLLTNNATTAFTLPLSANVGDIITVSGAGSNGWDAFVMGLAWQAQTNDIPNGSYQNWQSVASSSDGTHLVAVVLGGLIYTSADSGVTWTDQNNAPWDYWQSVASSSDGTHLVAAANGDAIYTSTNSGVTWTDQNNAPLIGWNSIASSSDGTHLVAVGYGFAGAAGPIYTSTDSGVTWTDQTNAPTTYWTCVASSADGTHLVAARSSGPIYTSTDSGVTWSHQTNSPSAYWTCVASSSDGTHLVAVANGYLSTNDTIYTSTNSGLTWSHQNNAPPAYWWQSVASSSDGTHLVAVVYGYAGTSGPIYTSTNSGLTWSNVYTAPPGELWQSVASSADGTKMVAVAGPGQIYTSSKLVLNGVAGTSAQFQYVGNDVWQPLGESASQISGGTLSTAVLPAVVVTNMETGVTLGGAFTGSLTGAATLANNVAPGIAITNAVITNSTFAGNGANLTNLNPANLSAGTANINITGNAATATVASNVVPGLSITNAILTSSTFAGNGASLTNLNASSVTGGTLSNAELPPNLQTLNSNNAVNLTNFQAAALPANVLMTDPTVLQSTVYSSAGTNAVVVPFGATVLTAKLWGAGGGGSGNLYYDGGGGAFVQKTINVVAGETFLVVVGQHGDFNDNNGGGNGSGDAAGGNQQYSGGTYSYVGQGGQASSLFYVSGATYLAEAVAGGGGGGGYLGNGGAGGDPGQTGSNEGGAGGLNGVGGAAGPSSIYPGSNYSSAATSTGISSLSSADGNGGSVPSLIYTSQGGGGGGGGYGGGGAGGWNDPADYLGGGGGGGGSYGDIIIAGSSTAAGNTGDPSYISPNGTGGVTGTSGGDGLAVVSFSGAAATASGSITAGGGVNASGNLELEGTHLIYDSANAVIDWGAGGTLYFRTDTPAGAIANFSTLATLSAAGGFAGNGAGLTNLVNASVTSAQNLRVVQGVIGANGSILNGASGFTVTSNSVGSYTINFTTAFSNIPTVVLSGAGCIASWTFANSSSFNVSVVTYGGTPLSQDFMFTAIGLR